MSSRKLRVLGVATDTVKVKPDGGGTGTGVDVTRVSITFSRKLTQLEVSGVRAVLDGEIK